MRAWDYLHCPPGTAHITIGAGDRPCAILMVGTRSPESTTHYPVEPAAARHGAAVAVATDSAREAYEGQPPITPARRHGRRARPIQRGQPRARPARRADRAGRTVC